MFIDPKELLEIKIFYKKVGRHYIAFNEEEFLAFKEGGETKAEEKEDFEELNVKMMPMTWGIFNDLQEAALRPDNNGERVWNYKFFKENKLIRLISTWDAKSVNAEGQAVPVPASPRMISNMSPDIAEAIVSTYDKMALVDADEEKKSHGRSITK